MHPVSKALLIILAVFGLLNAVIVGLAVWPLAPLTTWLLRDPVVVRPVILGVCLFWGILWLLTLVVAILRPKRQKRLVIDRQAGQITLSQKAIEQSVNKAVLTNHPVTQVATSVQLTKDRLAVVEVNAYTAAKSDLVALAQQVEQTVKARLADGLAVTVKKVKINLQPQTAAKSGAARVV